MPDQTHNTCEEPDYHDFDYMMPDEDISSPGESRNCQKNSNQIPQENSSEPMNENSLTATQLPGKIVMMLSVAY